MKKHLLLLTVLAGLLLAGCSHSTSVYNVVDFPAPKKLSMQKMERCILDAGTANGWQMSSINPGLIEGVCRMRNGKHVAVVSIKYSATNYSILYKSSINLKYDPEKGKIHKVYNQAVQQLEFSINNQISSEN